MLRIKIVADDLPNDDGEWIELKPMRIVEQKLFDRLPHKEKWDYYNSQCPLGFHAVAVDSGDKK